MTPMEELLFLAHRIPFPPNKGDKVRSYHLVRYLTQHYRVHLGAFVDDPDDWKHADVLRDMCAEVHLIPLARRRATLRSATGLLTRKPLTLPYYHDAGMARWVDDLLGRRPVHASFVFSSAMGQYVEHHDGIRRVVDFVDVDSDKWRQYAVKCRGLKRLVYAREADCLLRYERHLASIADVSFFVSRDEADLFRSLSPDQQGKVDHFNQSVDTRHFARDSASISPYADHRKVIVFTGAMDYWPNADAVTWFARDVFPAVRKAHEDAMFFIVGSRPTDEVKRLATLPGVHVTGRVEDIRPYLWHAAVAVAPLRIARGVQTKVLEAMAAGTPTVVTSGALEGIGAIPGKHVLLADTAGQFSSAVDKLLRESIPALSVHARELVECEHEWENNLERVLHALQGVDHMHSVSSEGEHSDRIAAGMAEDR